MGIHWSEIYYQKKKNINKNFFLKKELLKPTKIYVKEILSLIRGNLIHGCAHITGGGLPGNLTRIIPNNICANIGLDKIKVKPIFKWIKKKESVILKCLKLLTLELVFVL